MVKVSSRNLLLPPPAPLERLCQSLATLDAILCPEWQDRYYSFNSRWNSAQHERMGSMRNGSGDEYYVLFTRHGAILKGFDHESAMAHGAPRPGMFDGIPSDFEAFLREPAFGIESTTFCLWHHGAGWNRGSAVFPSGHDPDGSEELLSILGGDPILYQQYAHDYFEVEIPIRAIEHVYRHQPITSALLNTLNAETAVAALSSDLDEIGYPAE